MLSHVHVGVSDFPRAVAFYSGLMGQPGFVLKFCRSEESWAGWMREGVSRPLFLVGLPYNREAASPGNGQTVALLASSRNAVDQCHEWAIRNGGTDEGAPGLRPHYHPNYYGTYFRDPDGNKLCVCFHDALDEAPS